MIQAFLLFLCNYDAFLLIQLPVLKSIGKEPNFAWTANTSYRSWTLLREEIWCFSRNNISFSI
jgi:hypothetical protein